MFSLRSLFETPYGYYDYIWVDVILIKETKKAILIEFDGKKAWFPKSVIARSKATKQSKVISIRISLYHWSKEFT